MIRLSRCIVVLTVAAVLMPTRAEPQDRMLTLRQALAQALESSPELAVYSAEMRASEAKLLQAALRPNPEATVVVEDFAGTGRFGGMEQMQTTLQFSQLIELGGKRSARRRVAASAHELTGKAYELKRVEVLANVTKKFIALVASQLRLKLATEATEAAKGILQSARNRLEIGKGSSLEERNAAVSLARSEVAEGKAFSDSRAARFQLASTWGSTAPTFELAEADLFALKSTPTYEELADRIGSSPEIVMWITERQLRQAELKAAQSQRVPNLTVGGGVRKLEGTGDYGLVAEISLPLPFFDRNQGSRAEAEVLVDKTVLGQRATEFRLRAVLLGLHQTLTQAASEVEVSQRKILPQAEEAKELAEEGYRQGRLSYLALADAQRTVFNVKQQYIEAARTYHTAVVEIERLTGQALQP